MLSPFKQPLTLTAAIRLAVLVVVILILIPVIIFVVYPWYKEWITPLTPLSTSKPATTETVNQAPTGHILLNLKPIGGESGLYEYNLDNGLLNRYPELTYFPHFNYDESQYVTLNWEYYLTDSNTWELRTDIYQSETDTGERQVLISTPKEETGEVRRPRISSQSEYYSYEVTPSFDGATLDEYDLNNWEIYIGETGEEATKVTNGAFVNFAPDSSEGFLFLRSDGVYFHYFQDEGEEGVEIPVFEFESGSAAANNHFTVSRDYSKFAIANVGEGEVVVATIDKWTPFTISEIKNYSLDGFWPVFSPDGRYLAIQEVDVEEPEVSELNIDKLGEQPTNSRLTIIDLESGEQETVADLEGYVQMQTFINDWVNSEPAYE